MTTSKRWQAFADAVALALGINVWVSIIVLPGLFAGAWRDGIDVLAACFPLTVLAIGLWRRSEVFLLLAFPSALMVPIDLAPQIVGSHVYGPIRFLIVALGLVTYLFGVSFFSSFYEPAPPASVRPLASSKKPVPSRWTRRYRIYRALAILSVIFPLVLLYTVNFDSANEEFLRRMYPGRFAHMSTVINLAVIAGWVLIYGMFFLRVLKYHRSGDRELLADLARIGAKGAARSARPRPVLYIAMACALGFAALFLLTR